MKRNILKSAVSLVLSLVMLLAAVLFTTTLSSAAESFVTPPMIAAGDAHTIALKFDGTVWTWGANTNGQLGNGTGGDDAYSSTPIKVSNLSDVIAVAARSAQSFAIKADGTVWAWGNNNYGVLGDGTTTDRSVPAEVAGLSGVIAIAAGNTHTFALKSDGTVWAWGSDIYGKLGIGTPPGEGLSTNPFPLQVLGLSEITAISTGALHSFALKSDGTVWAWGINSQGRFGDGTTTGSTTPVQIENLSDPAVQVSAIAAGAAHSIALRSNDTVWTWGQNLEGELGNNTAVGGNVYVPMPVSSLSGVSAIAAGSSRTAALKSDGTVWAWGDNGFGQLGDGTTISRNNPVQVSGLSDVIAVSLGFLHTVALRADGTVWAWGGEGTPGYPISVALTPMQVVGENGRGWLNLLSDTLIMSNFTQSDRYNFRNSSSNFTGTYDVSEEDFAKLLNYIRTQYPASMANNIINQMAAGRDKKWGGSCFGMSVTAILDKYGQINMKARFPGAAALWDIGIPKNNPSVRSAINYYQISQGLPFISTGFDVPYGRDTLTQKLTKLVMDAKLGKIMQFGFVIPGWGGHSIVIIGYEQGPNGSHNVLAYDCNYPDSDTIINISGDYETCYVEPYRRAGAVADIRCTTDFSTYDMINIDGTGENSDMATGTHISIEAQGTTTVTNAEGQTLTYNAATGEWTGDMQVLSISFIEQVPADDMPSAPAFIVEVADSRNYSFESTGSKLSVAVTNKDIYAAAEADNADSVYIAGNEGVSIFSDSQMTFTATLGINSGICDMVKIEGKSDGDAALLFYDEGALISGQTGDTTLTVFSDTTNIEKINFNNPYNAAIITGDGSGIPGIVTVLASNDSGNHYNIALYERPSGGLSISQGATLSLTYKSTIRLTAAGGTVTGWTSSNPSAATVDSTGLVTAVGKSSTTTITATTADGRSASCIVAVSMSFWQKIVYILFFGWLWGF